MKNLFFFNQRSNAAAQATECAYTTGQKFGVNPTKTPRFGRLASMFCLVFAMLMTLGVGEMWASTTFADGDVLFYDFSDVTGGGGVNWQANGSTMVYDQSGAGTIKCVIFTSSTTWTTDWTIAKTAKGSWANIKFPSDRPSGKNCLKINSAGTSATWTTISLAEKVAKGDFIMVYGGELFSWNQSNYYFIGSNNNTTDNTKALANANKSITINSETYKFGPVALPSGTYIQGHWASNLSCAIAAGSAYTVRGGSASTTYFTQKANSGDNYLYQVKKQGATSPTTSLSPTCPSEIDAGTKLSFTPGAAGVSVLGLTNSIKYYLKDGSTYTEKTLSDGKIDVSDLAEGDYSIITLLYDGYIYVKASTSNFSVVTPTTFSVTYNANYPASATSTSGSVPSDATAYTSGQTVTVKGNSGSLAAGGYTFAGWNTQADGLGTDRAASSTFSITANTQLYAKWTENMTTVTINVSPADAGTLTVDASAFTAGNTTTAGVSTNHTVVATANSGKVFLDWSTTGNATGTNSTNTYTLKGNGSAGTGTLTANFGIASGWYMEGQDFGGWGGDNCSSLPTTYQFARTYRGMTNVYYMPVTLTANHYFKVHNGNGCSNVYNFGSNSADVTVAKGTIYSLTTDAEHSGKVTSTQTNKWAVINTSTKKFWVQDQQTFHNVNVTNEGNGTKGTYKVTLETTSAFTKGSVVFETTQFASGETFKVIVTGVTGYIPTITIGATSTNFWKEAATYEATGTMSTSDIAVNITYTDSRALTFSTTTGCATLTATGPGSTSVTSGTKIKDGTSITFAQTASTGYNFSKWYSNNTGTSGTEYSTDDDDYELTISSTAYTIYPIYTAKNYTVTLDVDEPNKGSIDGAATSHTVYYNTVVTDISPLPTAAAGCGLDGF